MVKLLNSNFVFIGFMGSGKSTVGRELANRLAYRFIDTDQLIESAAGKSIPELFKISEDYFRSWEFQICKSLQSSKQCIISTGGGLLTVEKTATLLNHMGPLIYLKASAHVIYNRVKHSTHRPLLQVSNPLETIKSMLETRDTLYTAHADFIIDCDTLSVEDILNMILSEYDFT
ncbi:shikimate kinase [bacterium]|nr:shikimate kinase [bacterium]|tara:strand:- start:84 stop:605 length:522 start_codon:yes stop_codon:yes gene_type:complete